MTIYESLINKSEDCYKKAMYFLNKRDVDMTIFYKNASMGFKNKTLNLSVEKASKIKA